MNVFRTNECVGSQTHWPWKGWVPLELMRVTNSDAKTCCHLQGIIFQSPLTRPLCFPHNDFCPHNTGHYPSLQLQMETSDMDHFIELLLSLESTLHPT